MQNTGLDTPPVSPARPSATLVVVRDADGGPEVLMLRRAERGDHASGAWVFPGGLLDARDRDWHCNCAGMDDAVASAQLGMESGGLDYHVAAIRECFEESGLLLAYDERGQFVSTAGEFGRQLQAWRLPLHRGERSMGEFCETFGLKLAVERLAYHTRWVTPGVRPKRWDARFFFVEAPPGQSSAHDEVEMVEQLWLRPADALARGDDMKMLTPTRTTLELMSRFGSVAELLDHVRTPRRAALQVPRVAGGRHGMQPVGPADHAWAEVRLLDPLGHGTASYEIVPERPVRLSLRIIRVTAPNPGVMTGPGTNSYLVGAADGSAWAVVDPGPDDEVHLDRLVAAAPGPIRWILATHTHIDHSPGAVRLKAKTGAEVLGQFARHRANQDQSFAPDRELQGGERLEIGPGTTLRAIHTPGHASNHLCFLVEEEKTLFTGDHLMQGSTVVINPPDGDMGAYLRSLRELMAMDIDWLTPGHGFVMDRPSERIAALIEHRLKREAKVESAVRELGPADAATLVPKAYDDTPAHLHGWAQRSLTAHLFKLRDDGKVREEEGRWSLV
jgi:glyoxylase-like metal-dependent hydrolase (beta-lactamase superfamily II)/8-oxo-dGTP pyrophosphatase MutT (NUDIX family)